MAAPPPPLTSQPSSFNIAHIASPLLRSNLPGVPPFPLARGRSSLRLLELALERAIAEGADAIALTGSIVSAPPPLRQCDKGAYYKLDPEPAFSEARADYLLVKSLLESSEIPYVVTPGGEDCIEAFEDVFGVSPSANAVTSRNASRAANLSESVLRSSSPAARRAEEDKEEDEVRMVGGEEAGDGVAHVQDASSALSDAAVSAFQQQLGAEKRSAKGDLEDAAAPGCGGGGGEEEGGGGGCGTCAAGGGGEKGGAQDKDAEMPSLKIGGGGETKEGGAKNATWDVKGGWATPKGEVAGKVVIGRFCDHVPPWGPPQRLEYERRLWQGMLEDASALPQCHVQTFTFYPPNLNTSSGPDPDSPATASDGSVGSKQRAKRGQEDGSSGLEGASYYEREAMRHAHAASGKLLLFLSSLSMQESPAGLLMSGSKDGRVTYAACPSLAVHPHRFALHRLTAPTPMVNPRASKTALEIRLKAEVLQHRHFWGHQEITLGSLPDSAPKGQEKVVVFLDRDGVLNPQAAYNTGPQEMSLLPGAARAVDSLKVAGAQVVIVSSQACVGKGFVLTKDVHAVMDKMCRLLREEARERGSERGGEEERRGVAQPDCIMFTVGAGPKAIHPEYEDVSDAKPAPTSLLRGAEALGLAAGAFRGYMVGDRLTDLQAGRACGCKVVLVQTGAGRQAAAAIAEAGTRIEGLLGVAEDLGGAVTLILSDLDARQRVRS